MEILLCQYFRKSINRLKHILCLTFEVQAHLLVKCQYYIFSFLRLNCKLLCPIGARSHQLHVHSQSLEMNYRNPRTGSSIRRWRVRQPHLRCETLSMVNGQRGPPRPVQT
jgi:hypothetical protein